MGWVLFRSESLTGTWGSWGAMASLNQGAVELAPVGAYLSAPVVTALRVGALLATQRLPRGPGWVAGKGSGALILSRDMGAYAAVLLVFVASLARAASGTHNPFIYWRF